MKTSIVLILFGLVLFSGLALHQNAFAYTKNSYVFQPSKISVAQGQTSAPLMLVVTRSNEDPNYMFYLKISFPDGKQYSYNEQKSAFDFIKINGEKITDVNFGDVPYFGLDISSNPTLTFNPSKIAPVGTYNLRFVSFDSDVPLATAQLIVTQQDSRSNGSTENNGFGGQPKNTQATQPKIPDNRSATANVHGQVVLQSYDPNSPDDTGVVLATNIEVVLSDGSGEHITKTNKKGKYNFDNVVPGKVTVKPIPLTGTHLSEAFAKKEFIAEPGQKYYKSFTLKDDDLIKQKSFSKRNSQYVIPDDEPTKKIPQKHKSTKLDDLKSKSKIKQANKK